jgi:hypothetical protein
MMRPAFVAFGFRKPINVSNFGVDFSSAGAAAFEKDLIYALAVAGNFCNKAFATALLKDLTVDCATDLKSSNSL